METTIRNSAIQKLITANHNRLRSYLKALRKIKAHDTELYNMFKNMAEVSRVYALELNNHFDGPVVKLYTDSRKPSQPLNVGLFRKTQRHALLAECKVNEEQTQHAYQQVLNISQLPSKVNYVIHKQREVLKASHDLINTLHDKIAG